MDLRFEHALHSELLTHLGQLNTCSINHAIEVADNIINLCFASTALSEHYFPAVQHLTAKPSNDTNDSLTIYILEASQFNMGNIDTFIGKLFKNAYMKANINLKKPQATTSRYLNCGNFLYFYSENAQFGFWIIDNLSSLSNWHFANPLRYFFYDYLLRRKIQTSHVAAISNHHCAVLLSGPSGAGKSTTAFACLERNLNLLGDDHCLFSVTGTPTVFSLYNSVKIDNKIIEEFSHLNLKPRHYINNLGINKAIFYMNKHKIDFSKKPIKAILKLDKTSLENEPNLHRISPKETLQSILLSTLSQCPRAKTKLTIEHHQRLTEHVSGYCLKLSRNFEKNIALINRVLDE